MGGRGVAGTCVVLALAVACFRQLQPIQMMKQDQIDCAAAAMDMTSDVLGANASASPVKTWLQLHLLYLYDLDMGCYSNLQLHTFFYNVQALMSFAAVGATSRFYTSLSLFLSPLTAFKLLAVLAGVVHLTVGRCYGHGGYHELLVAVFVTFGLLCLAGLVVTFFSIAGALHGGV